MERCECRCHRDATGDVLEAEQRGDFFAELLAKNRRDHLQVRMPEGPRFTDELAAYFACPSCQPQHTVALSGRPEQLPAREARERAAWNPSWGEKPA